MTTRSHGMGLEQSRLFNVQFKGAFGGAPAARSAEQTLLGCRAGSLDRPDHASPFYLVARQKS